MGIHKLLKAKAVSLGPKTAPRDQGLVGTSQGCAANLDSTEI